MREPPFYHIFAGSEREWSVAHATDSGQCRDEGRERSYYNLRCNLQKLLLVHSIRFLKYNVTICVSILTNFDKLLFCSNLDCHNPCVFVVNKKSVFLSL